MRKKILIPVFFCLWVAAIYFFIDIPFDFGDALRIQNNFLGYLQKHNLITAIIIAAIVTVITVYKKWSDNKQFFFIKSLFRYYLGFYLLTYGLTKIIQTQFVLFPFAAWQLPLEKVSGSDLTWAFLGRAPWFQVLLGFLEFIPAMLNPVQTYCTFRSYTIITDDAECVSYQLRIRSLGRHETIVIRFFSSQFNYSCF